MNNLKLKIAKTFLKVRKNYLHGNKVYNKKSGFLRLKVIFNGNDNVINVDDSFLFKCKFNIFGSNNRIIIKKGCILKNVEFWVEGNNNNIIVDEKCNFCGKAQIACLEGKKITFGKNLLCSSNVIFRTGDSHAIYDLNGNRTNLSKDISIGNNVWICQNAAFLKGSVVPDNCVVSFGSIVTKSFDTENVVLGGIPAHVIKKDILWKKEL